MTTLNKVPKQELKQCFEMLITRSECYIAKEGAYFEYIKDIIKYFVHLAKVFKDNLKRLSKNFQKSYRNEKSLRTLLLSINFVSVFFLERNGLNNLCY